MKEDKKKAINDQQQQKAIRKINKTVRSFMLWRVKCCCIVNSHNSMQNKEFIRFKLPPQIQPPTIYGQIQITVINSFRNVSIDDDSTNEFIFISIHMVAVLHGVYGTEA